MYDTIMYMREKLLYVMLSALMFGFCPHNACANTIVYKLTMSLKVPRVYDNTASKGYRKIQKQKITGYIYVDREHAMEDEPGEPTIISHDMVNNTHKVSGRKVSYSDAYASGVMWRFIGNNKTGKFKNVNLKYSLDLNPSYNIGADEPDNTLIITLAGYGVSEKSIKGSVTGQMGCGCSAYGHVSPTRTLCGLVSDITPMCGTFAMKRVKTLDCCVTLTR